MAPTSNNLLGFGIVGTSPFGSSDPLLYPLADRVKIVVRVVGLTRGPVLAVAIAAQLVRSPRSGAVRGVRVGVATAAHELGVVRGIWLVDVRVRLHQMRVDLAHGLVLKVVDQPAHAADQQHVHAEHAHQHAHQSHLQVGNLHQNDEGQDNEPLLLLALQSCF